MKTVMKPTGQRNFFEFVSLILFSPVYLLVKLIPKDKKLYIYGSSLGRHFADNSKYLFLYASKNIDKIKSVFITKNKDLAQELTGYGYRVEYLYSLKGIRTILRAKKAFLSHSSRDIHPLLLGGAEIIQLWHGSSFKKIGYDADWRSSTIKIKLKNIVRRIVYYFFPYMYSTHHFHKVVASSEMIAKTYQSAFGIGPDRIEIIGQPRNDCFNKDYILDKKIFKEIEYLENLRKKFTTIISWLPTHRDLSDTTLIDLMDRYKFDNNKFSAFLQEHNIGFIAKPHPVEKEALQDKVRVSNNFIAYDFVDPCPLLRYTDILLTDYSSVFIDFLMTGRPLIFTPFDFDYYCSKNADIYYDYDKVTPGPKCRDWEETIVEITKIINLQKSNKTDSFAEKRLEINDQFNYHKNDLCQKIINRFFDLDT